MMRSILHAILMTMASLAATAELHAGCSRCGAQCATQRVCRTLCTTKSVECTEWGESCREVCLPPHSSKCGLSGLLSRFCGLGGGAGCDDPACDDPTCDDPSCRETCDQAVLCDDPEGGLLGGHGPASWFSKLHGTCDTRVRKKLMRKTIITQVPVTECIVEELCPQCCSVAPALPADPVSLPQAEPPSFGVPRMATDPAGVTAGFAPIPPPNSTPYLEVPASATTAKPFFQTVGDEPVPQAPPTDSGPVAENPASGVSPASAGFFQRVGDDELAETPIPGPIPGPLPAGVGAPPLPQTLPQATLPLQPPARPRSPAATLKKSAGGAGKSYNYAPLTGPSWTEPQPAGSGRVGDL